MPLATRQTHTAFAQKGVIALRQIDDELICKRGFGRDQHLVIRGLGAAIADVVHRGTRKNHGLLRHDANARTQVVQSHVVDVDAVQQNLTGLRVVKAQQQTKQSGFASATGAHDGHGLAGLNDATQARQGQGLWPRGVVEIQALHGNR